MCPDRAITRQSGFSMPVAIFILVVMALLGAAMVQLVSTGHMSYAHETLSTRAFYAAESGAQWGMNRLFAPGGPACEDIPCFTSPSTVSFPTSGLEGCSVQVQCEARSEAASNFGTRRQFGLTSTGSCGTGDMLAERQISVRAWCDTAP